MFVYMKEHSCRSQWSGQLCNSFLFSLYPFVILGKMPTVVSPELYRTRFCEAMDKYFLMVPDHWTGLGLNCWNEAHTLKWTRRKRGLGTKDHKVSYMFCFFVTFTTVCRGLSVLRLGRPSVAEGFETPWICTLVFDAYKLANRGLGNCTSILFHVSWNLDSFQRSENRCMVGDEIGWTMGCHVCWQSP